MKKRERRYQHRTPQNCLRDQMCVVQMGMLLYKIMGAILDISGLHKIDPSLISLVETQPSCIEDRVLNLLTMTSWEGHPSQDTWLKCT